MMKLTVLVDNNTYIDQYYLAEPAVSYYLEDEKLRILFDTGYSDVFLKNARAMNINLADLTHLVLSHGHNDHTGGLKYLAANINCQNTELIAHPDCFAPKYDGKNPIGAPFTAAEINEMFNFTPMREPLWLSRNLLFLGEIPQIHEWEKRTAIGTTIKKEQLIPDYNYDDTALVYLTDDNGIFIITGCSHSGIANIIAYAQKLTGRSKINGILGGFHLLENNKRLDETIDYLRSLEIKMLYPAHCISLTAKAAMLAYLPTTEVGVGLEINFNTNY